MKYKIILLLNMALLFAGCTDILDIEPNNKVVADKVLTTEEGIAMHMANLYGRLPIEDFSYAIDKGFNWGIGNTDPNNGGRAAAMYCDEAMHSEFDEWGSEGFNFWERYTDDKGLYNASVGIYTLIRDINNLLETIPTLNTSNNKKHYWRVKLLFYVHIHILLWQSGMVEFRLSRKFRCIMEM